MNYIRNLVQTLQRPPQSMPLRADQVPNSAGGYAWAVDDWARLRRWIVLGSEGGSYYAGERALGFENVDALRACIEADGPRVVREIVAISRAGRAPKNGPALFALAMAAGAADPATRRAALDALPEVARIGTHLLQFVSYVHAFRGWGRSLRRAVGRWYTDKPVDDLAYQVIKYRQREGYSHRDLLRLAHPALAVSSGNPRLAVSEAQAALFTWIAGRAPEGELPRIVQGFERAQVAGSPAETAALVRDYRLPREAVPTEQLGSAEVWEALLADMPLTAMIRNLATMTRVGLLTPGGAAVGPVTARLADAERIRRARVHPIAVLAALKTYESGRGARGQGTWAPVREVVDALDGAFYLAFGNVERTGRRILLALDVSGSMEAGMVAGVPGLTPRVASAAMALVTVQAEPNVRTIAFASADTRLDWSAVYGRRDAQDPKLGIRPLAISPRQRLDDVLKVVGGLPFGGTDCALPMLYALEKGLAVDAFVVYTDSETWHGRVHPAQALAAYRRQSGIAANLVVVGMVANRFTIADPRDPRMLDVVGFDTATPNLIADFIRGDV